MKRKQRRPNAVGSHLNWHPATYATNVGSSDWVTTHRLIQSLAFNQDNIDWLSIAYEDALKAIHISDPDDPINEISLSPCHRNVCSSAQLENLRSNLSLLVSTQRLSDRLQTVVFVRDSVLMTKCTQKPILHVVLIDRDQWAVEAEWPDGTLERINTFNDPSSATDWISTQSEAWFEVRNFISE